MVESFYDSIRTLIYIVIRIYFRYKTKTSNPTGAKTSGGSGPKKISSQGQNRPTELINPNRLKIVAGSAKGKKIDSPDVYLRPMMAKVCNKYICHKLVCLIWKLLSG